MAVAAHNFHKDRHAGRVQEGGTGSIFFGDASGYVKKVGRDDEGLGRWCWILLGGAEGHNTRIITAYKPVVGRLDMYRTKVLWYRTYVLLACPTKVRR
jgi:hypothetical protein